MTDEVPRVAVVGGAIAGAEIAARLAEQGIHIAVFEMNDHPFGKIESGLPCWHTGLRRREARAIVDKLDRPGIEFVPRIKIGRDLALHDLIGGWGFAVVVLASGAWHDRPLPLPDAEQWVGKGLVYQNQFVAAFNRACGESTPEEWRPRDGAVVIGGGLASLDVVKILMIETTRAALAARGHDISVFDLEAKGIPKILAGLGLTWEDLRLRGSRLFYRRRIEDMPLVPISSDASPERVERTRANRRRALGKLQAKYLFHVEERWAPIALLGSGEQLAGVRFARTQTEGVQLRLNSEVCDVPASLVVSAIGSIPEPISGVSLDGDLLQLSDPQSGRLAGFSRVFSAGNAATGRGSIAASRRHAAEVSAHVIDSFLGLGDDHHVREAARHEVPDLQPFADQIAKEAVEARDTASTAKTLQRIRERQQLVGYGGDLKPWLRRVDATLFE